MTDAAPVETGSAPDSNAGTITQNNEAVPAPQTWSDNWRYEILGSDQATVANDENLSKEYKQLERYGSPQDVWKKTRSLEQEFSKREPRIEKSEGMSDEQLKNWRTQEGIPATSKDYNLDFESGLVIGDADKPFVDSMLEYAHQHDISESAMKPMVEWFFTDREAQDTDWQQKSSEFRENNMRQLSAEWAGDYKGRINAIGELFVDNPDLHDKIMKSIGSDGFPIGDDIEIVKWASELAMRLNPTATIVLPGGESGESIESRITEIEGWMHSSDTTTREKYFRSDAVQQEYERLLEAKEKLDAR